jgi:hypothetical protein
MRKQALTLLVLVTAAAMTACTPMYTVRGSSLTYLTPAGATLEVARPGPAAAALVEQIFIERGYQAAGRAQVSSTNLVLFFTGSRDRQTRRGYASGDPNGLNAQLGSWFAVRVKDQGPQAAVVTFYGKPMVYGAEACAEGDRDLKDAGYVCKDVIVRADWPGLQLVEGREETKVISAIISTVGERVPR